MEEVLAWAEGRGLTTEGCRMEEAMESGWEDDTMVREALEWIEERERETDGVGAGGDGGVEEGEWQSTPSEPVTARPGTGTDSRRAGSPEGTAKWNSKWPPFVLCARGVPIQMDGLRSPAFASRQGSSDLNRVAQRQGGRPLPEGERRQVETDSGDGLVGPRSRSLYYRHRRHGESHLEVLTSVKKDDSCLEMGRRLKKEFDEGRGTENGAGVGVKTGLTP